jgi:UDP-3-O-[3-hydroxymyristoyl] glucosamine N-acyltransferase
MDFSGDYQCIDEKPFDYLALTASGLSQPSCVFLDSADYIGSITGNVTMVLTTAEVSPLLDRAYGKCIVEKPRELFFVIHNYLSAKEGYARDRFPLTIGSGCKISPLASIAESNIIMGKNVTIEEFVVIRENTVIDDDTIIRAGCIIGGQGFEFKRTDSGLLSVVHAGGVKIGKNVEIQYNTCVDRGIYPWDDTAIGDYSKIDNLVHIAHGVKIGKNVMVVANVGLGGRTIVKDGAWLGFGATITNGITVGEDARANMGAVVTRSVPDNGSVTGNFAIEHRKFLRNLKAAIAENAKE